ncbi:unnamed protein product [Chrysoparadoxa australica]
MYMRSPGALVFACSLLGDTALSLVTNTPSSQLDGSYLKIKGIWREQVPNLASRVLVVGDPTSVEHMKLDGYTNVGEEVMPFQGGISDDEVDAILMPIDADSPHDYSAEKLVPLAGELWRVLESKSKGKVVIPTPQGAEAHLLPAALQKAFRVGAWRCLIDPTREGEEHQEDCWCYQKRPKNAWLSGSPLRPNPKSC